MEDATQTRTVEKWAYWLTPPFTQPRHQDLASYRLSRLCRLLNPRDLVYCPRRLP